MRRIFAFLLPFLLFSQLIPYYGKSKVIYNKFRWKEYKTQHFRILFYDKGRLPEIAQYAEESYEKLRRLTGVDIKEKIPIIFYRNHFEFEQTNLYGGIVPEEVLGFSEPFKRRVVVPADLPPFSLKRLINHELTHIFEFYILYEGLSPSAIFRIQVPLWMMEGFAEFATGDWEPFPLVTVVDAVANDTVPRLSRYGDLVGGQGRIPYDFGHAMFDFIEHKYGLTGVRKLWWEVKKNRIIRYTNPLKRTFHIEREVFNSEFKHFLRVKYSDFLRRDMPDDYGVPISPRFPFVYIFSYQISPSGEVAAILTVNYSQADYDIILISMRDGKKIKNITPGITTKYQKIRFGFDPAAGKGIAWDKNGEKIAFFGKRTKYYRLFVIDSFKGRFLKEFKLYNIYNSTSPVFTKDGKGLVFVGFQESVSYIFYIDLETGKIRKMSPGKYYIREVALSPDEKHIAFVANIGKEEHIFLADYPEMKNIRQITFKKGVNINPSFMNNHEILFSSNREGGFDLYSIDVNTGEVKRYTRVSTGCFFPQYKNGKIYFTGYFRNNFRLYTMEPKAKEIYKEKKREVTGIKRSLFSIQESKIRLRKGIGKLSPDFTLPISIAYSTDGRVFTSAYLSFSDIFSDHTLYFYAANDYYYQSYDLGYINQKGRLWWRVRGFQYKLYYFFGYYYPEYYGYVPSIVLRRITGADAYFYYPLDLYHRLEASVGAVEIKENTGVFLPSGKYNFYSGKFFNVNLNFVRETTRFKGYGPVAGDTLSVYFGKAFPLDSAGLENKTIKIDARKYVNLGRDFLLAFRTYYYGSFGKTPFFDWIGGNNEIRSVGYRSIIGTQTFFFNAEFRFPITYATYTAIGNIGPIRGVIFFDIGGARYGNFPFKFAEGSFPNIRLVDAFASYGYGLELFLFSFPIHIEYVKRTDLSSDLYSVYNFWIGFDF